MATILGKLYLIPSPLGEPNEHGWLSVATKETVTRLRHFIVESERASRRYLATLSFLVPIQELNIQPLSQDHVEASLISATALLSPLLLDGVDMGLMSDAGLPCIADPGRILVMAAHEQGIKVVPLVGPSSILLALIASGLEGQRFAFHGYLPRERADLLRAISNLEIQSKRDAATQIFFDTPYRSGRLLDTVLETCHPDTLICVAKDLTLETESVRTSTVLKWRQSPSHLDKRPTVILLFAS